MIAIQPLHPEFQNRYQQQINKNLLRLFCRTVDLELNTMKLTAVNLIERHPDRHERQGGDSLAVSDRFQDLLNEPFYEVDCR
jgi:hypothetical protein